MSLFNTLKEMYLCDILVDFEFAGVKYLLGKLEMPNSETIGFGITGKYDQNFVFQIIKTLENHQDVSGEIWQLGNGYKEYLVFQYETEKQQKFLVIKEKDKPPISKEEIGYLWNLL